MFRAWSCGHSHQPDASGRTQTCDDVNWYVCENDENAGYSTTEGLVDGDYTLHTKRADGTFSPARWGGAVSAARDIAHRDGRRLMVRSADGVWLEVQ